MNFDLLPEDCFAHILSFTSPKDAIRSSIVSSSVRLLADSDSVWHKFLPSGYKEILSRLTFPLLYSSNKQLFLMLCGPCLIDGGKKIFSIERSTSKKSYILSARELSIAWASHSLYWSWKPLAESRFAEVAELITIWWLEIFVSINSKMLSPKTVYSAYLIVKFADRAYGLDLLPCEVSIEIGNFKSQCKVNLSANRGRKKPSESANFRSQIASLRPLLAQEGAVFERRDGWIEIELGSFLNDGSDDKEEVRISVKEVKGQHLRGGLIVEGIEFRPKHM